MGASAGVWGDCARADALTPRPPPPTRQSEEVDAAGGLVVIATSIPESEREWVQWKGRTARNDRRGRYAVVLCREDAPLAGNDELLAAHAVARSGGGGAGGGAGGGGGASRHAESLIAGLLAVRDRAMVEKLEGLSADVRRGQRLNELCEAFYAAHGRAAEWPAGREQVALRDFLQAWSGKSAADIAEFAASVGLVEAAGEYARASAYGGD